MGRRDVSRAARARVGAGGRRGRRIPRLVRVAHAPQPEPGRGVDSVPDGDGAGRERRPARGSRADPLLPAIRRIPDRRTTPRERIAGCDGGRRCRPIAASTRGSSTTPTRRPWPRRRASSHASPTARARNACWRPSSSPTSWARPISRLGWATEHGESCSSGTTASCAASWRASTAESWTRRATDSCRLRRTGPRRAGRRRDP